MQLTIKQIAAAETWPLRHEVMWPNMPFEFIKLSEDEQGKHLGLFVNDELTSIVSIFETAPGVAQFRKFATKSAEQGKGYGTKLLQHLIHHAVAEGFQTLWCNARVDKMEYYKKFGMVATDETYSKENIKFVILKNVF